MRTGTYLPTPRRSDSPILAEHLEVWMATRSHLSHSVRSRHRSAYNRWILPAIGNLRLVDIRARDLEAILAKVTAEGRGFDIRINVTSC